MGSPLDKIHSQVMDHLIQHTTQVPKGFLRQKTLELLGEKPMSGSEIADEIHRRTLGQWKPGPGSIYPLLAWLQKNGYAVPAEEKGGLKRYTLTGAGRKLLEEQKSLPAEMVKDKPMAFCLMDLLWFGGNDELREELHQSMFRLVSSLGEFNAIMGRKLSKKAILEVKEAVDEATGKIEALNKSLKE
jgi:DNA-binding PadR family transcriptional regulator